jgi:toxin YoeB
MEIKFLPKAEEDLAYWKQTGNKRIMKRITTLLADILEHPFTGIGKPEPLKGDLQGLWSRRITPHRRQDGVHIRWLLQGVEPSDTFQTIYLLPNDNLKSLRESLKF